MVNDGTWHHYSVGFSGSLYPTASIWVEDFFGQSTSLGNAYFDNISVVDTTTGQTVFLETFGAAVPEPGAALFGIAGLGVAAFRRRR